MCPLLLRFPGLGRPPASSYLSFRHHHLQEEFQDPSQAQLISRPLCIHDSPTWECPHHTIDFFRPVTHLCVTSSPEPSVSSLCLNTCVCVIVHEFEPMKSI